VFEQKLPELRDASMRQLTATLGMMLRQACRYRGTATLPDLPPFVPPAAAAESHGTDSD
jgi:hypothetical protein